MHAPSDLQQLKYRYATILYRLEAQLKAYADTIAAQYAEIEQMRHKIKAYSAQAYGGANEQLHPETNYCNTIVETDEYCAYATQLSAAQSIEFPMLRDVAASELEAQCVNSTYETTGKHSIAVRDSDSSEKAAEHETEAKQEPTTENERKSGISVYQSEESVVGGLNNFEEIQARILYFTPLEQIIAEYGQAAVRLVSYGLPEAFWLTVDGTRIECTITPETTQNYTKLQEFLSYIEHRIEFFDADVYSEELSLAPNFYFIAPEQLRYAILARNGGLNSDFAEQNPLYIDIQRDVGYVAVCFECPLIRHLRLQRTGDLDAFVDILRYNGLHARTDGSSVVEIRYEVFD